MTNQHHSAPGRPGLVQLYMGDGKGKTTAAMGIALRAAGAGYRVLIVQFAKQRTSCERKALERFKDDIDIEVFGTDDFVVGPPTEAQLEAAGRGLARARDGACSGDYGLVILDEAAEAAALGLIQVNDLLNLANKKAASTELVLTGRRADPRLIARADLVTEMRCVKHYFDRGIQARRGMEE